MRRVSKKVLCGDVAIGGGAEISIQSMTNTDTRDINATVEQIAKLQDAGCQIIRCAVLDEEAAAALGKIKSNIKIPVVADIHFDYRLAISAIKNGADKIRINPGNIGDHEKVKKVLDAAKEREIPIRIGVNSGSLEKEILKKYGGVTPEALAESALNTISFIRNMNFDQLVLSIKSSDVRLNQEAHRLISGQTDLPLHIGITESGTVQTGSVKSAIGIGALLLDGIGDTMRVSLTGDPIHEILFAKEILRALNLRKNAINLVSCPTCGRTKVDLVKITQEVEEKIPLLEEEMEKYNIQGITVAVMGCEVNGPGEASEADFGVACGKGKGILIQKGKIIRSVPEERISEELFAWIRQQLGMKENPVLQ